MNGEQFDRGTPEIQAAFELLVKTVSSWRQSGRKTTSAGVKSGMRELDPAFDESALGFADFSSFLEEAAGCGKISKYRQPNGHWLILMPGEEPSEPATPPHESYRLRPDLWNALIDWDAHYLRKWDKDRGRAFMYPVDDEGVVLWESRPERFCDIPSTTQARQMEWMHEFARTTPDLVRPRLEASLGAGMMGAFRKELVEVGLLGGWQNYLQHKIVEHALAWANECGVPSRDILAAQKNVNHDTGGGDSARSATRNVGSPVASQRVDSLRQLVHQAVDRMSLDELASLPIRAGHLLNL